MGRKERAFAKRITFLRKGYKMKAKDYFGKYLSDFENNMQELAVINDTSQEVLWKE